MWNVVKTFCSFSPARSALTALAGVVVLFLLVYALNSITGGIMGFFGFDTTATLKKKLTTSENNVATVVDANKGLSKAVTDISATKDNELKAVDNAQAEKAKVEEKAKTILSKKDAKIASTKASGVKAKKSSATIEKDVSTVQIETVWTAYCEFNEDTACDKKGDR